MSPLIQISASSAVHYFGHDSVAVILDEHCVLIHLKCVSKIGHCHPVIHSARTDAR